MAQARFRLVEDLDLTGTGSALGTLLWDPESRLSWDVKNAVRCCPNVRRIKLDFAAQTLGSDPRTLDLLSDECEYIVRELWPGRLVVVEVYGQQFQCRARS